MNFRGSRDNERVKVSYAKASEYLSYFYCSFFLQSLPFRSAPSLEALEA